MSYNDFIDPAEFRKQQEKPCPFCGLPRIQQYRVLSHRGNFRVKGRKVVIEAIGKVCQCSEMPETKEL